MSDPAIAGAICRLNAEKPTPPISLKMLSLKVESVEEMEYFILVVVGRTPVVGVRIPEEACTFKSINLLDSNFFVAVSNILA
jgi:hypothetical protein